MVVSAALLLPSAAHADPSGLVAAYNFDSATAATAVDASGSGNTGTIAGATYTASGRNGGALSFDGVDDRVNIADADSLDLTTGMTMEAWIYPTSTGSWRSILMKERAAGFSYAFYASDTNRPWANVWTSAEYDVRNWDAFPLNAWTHLASTYDGATLRLYVNGTQVASRSLTGSLAVSSGALRIGGNAIWGEHFAGRIDDVRIFNTARTAAEVAADRLLPVVSADTPPSAPGALTATVAQVKNVDLAWTAATDDLGVTGYRVHRSDTAGFTPSAATLRTTVTTTSWRDTLTAPGTYYYKVLAVDTGDQAGPAADASALLPADTTPPAVTLSSAPQVSRLAPLTVTRSDDWGTPVVDMQVDGGAFFSINIVNGWQWNTATYADGPHTLVARATDAAGNVTLSDPVAVTVFNGSRGVTVTAPAAGSTVTGTITVKADVANAQFGVQGVRFTMGSGAPGSGFGSPIGLLDTVAPYEVEVDTTMWGINGPTWITASVYDHSSEYPWVSPPVGFTTSNVVGTPGNLAANVDGDDVHLSWEAPTGGTIPVATYSIHRGSTPGFAISTNNQLARITGLTYDDLDRPPGTYYYKVLPRAESGFGNTPGTVMAVIAAPPDPTPPTVSVNGACNNALVSGTVALTATAADNVGVTSVQYKLDGADLGAAVTSAPYSRNWVTTGSTNGAHVITAVARDAAGNTTTSAACPFTVSNPVTPPTSLVAAYGFEETSGATTIDSSGSGHAGTISGAARTTTGKFGRALAYDGVDDLVSVPHTSAFNLGSAMTMSAWINPTSTGTWRSILMKERPGGFAFALYASDVNRPWANVFTSSEFDVRNWDSFPLNAWTHLASTYDGTTLRLYVNGTQVASRSLTGSLQSATGPLAIGGNSVWGEWFKGQIDEVRVYSRALSASEVVADRDTAVAP